MVCDFLFGLSKFIEALIGVELDGERRNGTQQDAVGCDFGGELVARLESGLLPDAFGEGNATSRSDLNQIHG
jgi:hypothetical protein